MLKTKIKVLIMNPNEGLNGVTWWRLYRPWVMLADRYPDELDITYNRGDLQTIDFLKYDIYYFLRPYQSGHFQALEALTLYARTFSRPIKILLDFDDDNSNLPLYHLHYQDEGYNWPNTQN